MADQLCTTAQVKARLFPAGIADATDDTLISELIDEVSDWVQHNTGRKFIAEAGQTYVFDTEAGYVLRIPRGIRAITSMGVNNTIHQPDSGGSYTTIPAADRLLRPKAADLPVGWPFTEVLLFRGVLTGTISSFGRVDNGCTITGDFGFATTPPDIQAVAIDGTVSAYQMRKNGTSGVFGVEANMGVPWWQFTQTSWKTLGMYRYPGIA